MKKLVRRLKRRFGAAPVAPPAPAVPFDSPLDTALACSVCRAPVEAFEPKGDARRRCPDCGALERQRVLADLLRERRQLAPRRILVVAPSRSELQLLRAAGGGEIVTVDVRPEAGADLTADVCAMPEVASASFDMVVASHVLSFVHDLDAALAEFRRVLRPDGLLLISDPVIEGTHTEILDAGEPGGLERVTRTYGPEAYERYRVGTFRKFGSLDALEHLDRGFTLEELARRDAPTGATVVWWAGAPEAAEVAGPAVRRVSRLIPAQRRVYSTPVDPALGFKQVTLTLSTPAVPTAARSAEFACHAHDTAADTPLDAVYATQTGGVLRSQDLGESWDYTPTPETGEVRLFNAFQRCDGGVLLQGLGPDERELTEDPDRLAPVFVCDADLRVQARVQPGRNPWHGPRAIDEAGGTLIYAEYPHNSATYWPGFGDDAPDLLALCEDPHLFRSTDGGRTWDTVLRLSWREIRHFHTVAADPHAPGVWWASSGDRAAECRVWRSDDDGLNWKNVTPSPAQLASCGLDLHPSLGSRHQAVFRHTDLAVLPDRLVWGADDMLGDTKQYRDPTATLANRVGSRVFVSPKSEPLRPRSLGVVGSHIRSIVDVGPGWLLMTEAKARHAEAAPQVAYVGKTEPMPLRELFRIDRFAATGTGFTYSRNSRVAKNGRFFTSRGAADVFPGGPRVLQWDIAFD